MISLSPPTPSTSERVQLLLQSENKIYTIIKNQSSSVDWWKAFGYSAKLDENGEFQRIAGFVSCFKCFKTFIYSNTSGTTRLKQHANKCFDMTTSSSSSSSSSTTTAQTNGSALTQVTLAQHGFKKNARLSEKEIENIKQLSAQWVCRDLRPFCTLEDVGFRALAQELIRIGLSFIITKKHKYFLSPYVTGMELSMSVKFFEAVIQRLEQFVIWLNHIDNR